MRSSVKLTYIPGAISLLLLFPLSMYQLDHRGTFTGYHTMEITFYERDPQMRLWYRQQSIPDIGYQVINLAGDMKTDEVKIAYIKILLEEMASQADTTRGVRIYFKDSTKYESFVQILELCHKAEKNLAYALHEDAYWIFTRRPPKPPGNGHHPLVNQLAL